MILILSKSLMHEKLENLIQKVQDHVPPQVKAETMTGCDAELPTANTEILSDRDFLTEFR